MTIIQKFTGTSALVEKRPEQSRNGLKLFGPSRFSLDAADDLAVGQSAQLRFSGLHDRGLPLLTATLTRLSADRLFDEKTGLSY